MNETIVDQNKEIISVNELNKSAKNILERSFNNINVIGEISNISRPSSGHIYFTLKDDDAAIRCAMFRNQNLKLNFRPENGDKCILNGQISLYAPRGDYQLIVKSIEPAGYGNLMQQFENLKEKLNKEGLFNIKSEDDLKKFPKHICIITSLSTAALQDILSALNRRAPSANVSISPAIVQGDSGAKSLLDSLERIITFNDVNEFNKIDTVIISRGGGSIEDLWCFNDENLAREIANYPIPIISGVGHEIDFTICDFASSLRAPTPTAAAEIASETLFNINTKLNELLNDLKSKFETGFEKKLNKINTLKIKIKNPVTYIRELSQKIDTFELRFNQSLRSLISNKKELLNNLENSVFLKSPILKTERIKNSLTKIYEDLVKIYVNLMRNKKLEIDKYSKSLEILNPFSILERGYSIITNKNGKAIRSSVELSENEILDARFGQGKAKLSVKSKNED